MKKFKITLKNNHKFIFAIAIVPILVGSIAPLFGFIIYPALIIVATIDLIILSGLIYYLKKPPFYKELIEFIKSNGLYDEYVDNNGRHRQINKSLVISSEESNEIVIIKLYKDGSRYCTNLDKYSDHLSSIVSGRTKSINKKLDCIEYIFNKKPLQRYHYRTLISSHSYEITLDSIVYWNYVRCPHVIIMGTSGTGKSYMDYYLINALIKQHAYFFILDIKNLDYSSIKDTIHTVANKKPEIFKTIKNVESILNDRLEKLEENGLHSFLDYKPKMRPIFLLIDEYSSMVSGFDSKQKKEFDSIFKQILLLGRAAGVFSIISSQKFELSSSGITSEIRDQFSLRIALGKMNDDSYKMMFGSKQIEYESMENQKGYYMIDGSDMLVPEIFYTPLFDSEFDIGEAISDIYLNHWGYTDEFYSDPVIDSIIRKFGFPELYSQ